MPAAVRLRITLGRRPAGQHCRRRPGHSGRRGGHPPHQVPPLPSPLSTYDCKTGVPRLSYIDCHSNPTRCRAVVNKQQRDRVLKCICLCGRAQEEPELEDNTAEAGEPSLVVQPWWMNHLLEARGADTNEIPGGTTTGGIAEADVGLRLLRWAYGAVVNTTAAAVMERRRELLSGKTADAALLGLYEDIARVWRRLNELGSKKSRLQQLRCALRPPSLLCSERCMELARFITEATCARVSFRRWQQRGRCMLLIAMPGTARAVNAFCPVFDNPKGAFPFKHAHDLLLCWRSFLKLWTAGVALHASECQTYCSRTTLALRFVRFWQARVGAGDPGGAGAGGEGLGVAAGAGGAVRGGAAASQRGGPGAALCALRCAPVLRGRRQAALPGAADAAARRPLRCQVSL